MAEHSRCQPGRPSPNGESHAAPTFSSKGCAFFQSAKSLTDSLSYLSVATRAPGLRPPRSRCDNVPYDGKLAILKYTSPSATYALWFSMSPPIISIIAGILSVARG